MPLHPARARASDDEYLEVRPEFASELARVRSINASGHKYGLVYPGLGWVLWRAPDAPPEELAFHVDYLGGGKPPLSPDISPPRPPGGGADANPLRLPPGPAPPPPPPR